MAGQPVRFMGMAALAALLPGVLAAAVAELEGGMGELAALALELVAAEPVTKEAMPR